MTGVLPLGLTEPLNQIQRDALTTVGTTYAPAQGYMSGAGQSYRQAVGGLPSATPFFDQGNQFFNKASQYLGQGTQTLTPEMFASGVSGYMNPYQQQVVEANNRNIMDQAARMRSGIKGQFSNMGAFGSDTMGVQLGMLDQNTLRQIGDSSGQLLYQGYNDATKNFLGQFNQGNQNYLTAASTAGQLGNSRTASGFDSIDAGENLARAGIDLQRGNQQNWYYPQEMRLRAGNQIQEQNQNTLNAMNAWQTSPTDFLSGASSPFMNSTTQIPGKQSTLSKIGDVTSAAGQLMMMFGG